MIGGLIVTHGRLAIELLNAAEQIVGEIHHVAAVSLGWHDNVDTAAASIAKAIERVRTPASPSSPGGGTGIAHVEAIGYGHGV